MSDFEINPNFNMNGFDNSINEFNKSFSNSINSSNEALKSNLSFDEVFNSINENKNQKQQNPKIELKLGENSNKQLSPTAKLASDIGKSFSGGITELNTVERQSEKDIETFASGGDISIHQVMISAQKSQLAMQMAIQLRNQMLNAYNEFKNMSV